MTKLTNKGKGNVSDRDDWQTPQWLFDKLNSYYNFTFDCCSNGNNSKCTSWTSNFLMYVTAGIKHIHWINPPFSKAPDMIRHFFKVVQRGVGIYRMDNMETKIWQHILTKSDWIFIFNKRINYEDKAGKGAVFGSALFGIGLPPPKGLEGTTMIKNREDSK